MLRLLSTLALLFVGGLASARAQDWVQYKDAAAGYRVEFPSSPSSTTTSVDSNFGKVTTTIAEYHGNGDVTLRAAYQQFPKAIPGDPETFLDAATNGGVGRSGNKLREEKRVRVNGMPGRFAVFYPSESSMVSVCLLVLGSDRLYLLEAVVPRSNEDSPVVQRFLKSFSLVPRQ